jgi:HlyD family secretion protein
MNDKVQAGDLLVRLDDQDYAARVAAAEAEVEVRKRDRDAETVGKLAQDRRAGDDAVASAERQLVQARADFDQALRSRRAGSEADVSKSRDAVKAAQAKVGEARANARKVANGDGMPAQTRPEAALAAARAELSLADAAYERTRIRAPIDATLLQVNAKAGELAAPSIEAPLLVVGDLSSLRVRAEIEERDLPKVRIGQAAIVRSDAFPDREFNGKAVSIAQALGPAKLATRGPRKPTDVDVLEILIDLEGHPPLLPGMRVDVFFKADATVQSNAPGKAN